MPIFSIFLSPKPHTGDKFTPLYVIGELLIIESAYKKCLREE